MTDFEMLDAGTLTGNSRLTLSRNERASLWRELFTIIESYIGSVAELPVSPPLDVERIREFVEGFRFDEPRAADECLRAVASGLRTGQVHTSHPMYFGLFNPAPSTMSVAADALAAAFNPQLAAWSHSPLPVEIEQHLIRLFGMKFGMPEQQIDGMFTTGGAEANQTALLTALHAKWPEVGTGGLRFLPNQPVIYVSSEGHHSVWKAARIAGLGAASVRQIVVQPDLRLDTASLIQAIRRDRSAGLSPFLIVATAGTTGAGAIDPLTEVASIAQEERLWFHVDAAWGGAAILVPALQGLLAGIDRADSITFDAHKWLSVSMGAGMFLTRHSNCCNRSSALRPRTCPRKHDNCA